MKGSDMQVQEAERGPTRVRYSFEARRRAVRAMLGGANARAAAASVGADPTSAYRWLARYRADGWAGLRERRAAPGRRALVAANRPLPGGARLPTERPRPEEGGWVQFDLGGRVPAAGV